MSILDKVEPAGEATKWLKQLIYGDGGTGKTVYGASAGQDRTLILAAEKNGAKSLLNHPGMEKTPVLKINVWQDFKESYLALRNGEMPERDIILIDSVTELYKMYMMELLKKASLEIERRDEYTEEIQDYKYITNVMRSALIRFCDLDRHIIMTAQEELEKEEGTNERYWAPAVPPKLMFVLYGLVDVVTRLTVEDKLPSDKFTNQAQNVKSARVKARSRIKVPAIIQNPKVSDFLGKGSIHA